MIPLFHFVDNFLKDMYFEELYLDFWGKLLTEKDHSDILSILAKEEKKQQIAYVPKTYPNFLKEFSTTNKNILVAVAAKDYIKKKIKKLSYYSLYTKGDKILLDLGGHTLNRIEWKNFLVKKFKENDVEIVPKSKIQTIKNARDKFKTKTRALPGLLDTKSMVDVIYEV